MKNEAKEWAEDYFKRFDVMVNTLQEHPLINKVVYLQFKGLTSSEIEQAEQEITLALNEQAENWEVKDYPYQDPFVFDDYMREFYKISNGLHLDWNSHLFPTNIEKSKILKKQPIDTMCFPRTDGSEIPEGKLSLLALNKLLSYDDYCPVGHGDLYETSYGEDLREEEGGFLSYLDYFNDYHDAAITLKKGLPLSIILGQDHSACYQVNYHFDFVMYMEFVLSTYASTLVRGRNFEFQPKRSFNVGKKFQTIFKNHKYADLPVLMQKNRYNDLEYLLKTHFEEQGYEYGSLENFKSKSKDIYTQIETLLDIKIEDEFE